MGEEEMNKSFKPNQPGSSKRKLPKDFQECAADWKTWGQEEFMHMLWMINDQGDKWKLGKKSFDPIRLKIHEEILSKMYSDARPMRLHTAKIKLAEIIGPIQS